MVPLTEYDSIGEVPKEFKRILSNSDKAEMFRAGGFFKVWGGKAAEVMIGKPPEEFVQRAKDDKNNLYVVIKGAYDEEKRQREIETGLGKPGHRGLRKKRGSVYGRPRL